MDTEYTLDYPCRICYKCNSFCPQSNLNWFHCEHKYCIKCAAVIVNESLSLLNEIPRCIFPKCNQTITNKNNHSLRQKLPTKYRVPPTANLLLLTYDEEQKLIYGFIREIGIYTPNEIISTVYDFYNLLYLIRNDCYQCNSNGYSMSICSGCNGNGYTTNCKRCSSYFQPYECQQCYGKGTFTSNLGRCLQCKGSGHNIFVHNLLCQRCNGTGQYTKNHRCMGCNGNGWKMPSKCTLCNNSTYFKQICFVCNGNGKQKHVCNVCHGEKCLVGLDFNKLCNKQLLCIHCNKYSPKSRIMYWSKCNHIHCDECVIKYVITEIDEYRIPLCSLSGCNQELKLRDLDMINLLNGNKWYLKDRYYIKLKVLINAKNQFVCSYCYNWHSYGKDTFYWSRCKHEYGKKCAKSHVMDELIRSHTRYVPECKGDDCTQPLNIDDFKSLQISFDSVPV